MKQLTPRVKARELIIKYIQYIKNDDFGSITNAKKCALIVVDEIMKLNKFGAIGGDETAYWQYVKEEIEAAD